MANSLYTKNNIIGRLFSYFTRKSIFNKFIVAGLESLSLVGEVI